MLRSLASKVTAQLGRSILSPGCEGYKTSLACGHMGLFARHSQQLPLIRTTSIVQCSSLTIQNRSDTILGRLVALQTQPTLAQQCVRHFHAKGSKVRYLDFRYRFNTGHYRSHLLIIRKQKMKKHRRTKWRKKFKCLLAKKRLKREIAKEKTFRVELLTMIKRAEQFDPREYALRKIHEVNSVPRPKTKAERLEELKELIRVNRYQVDYIKPKHKRRETLEDLR